MILGIWDGHDSGAAVVGGNRIVAAVNEERFTRRKLEVLFPRHSIAYCLSQVPRDALKGVAYSTTDFSLTLTRCFPRVKDSYYHVRRKERKARFTHLNREILNMTGRLRSNAFNRFVSSRLMRDILARLDIDVPIHVVDHHEAHAASAYYTSGFGDAMVVTLDGLGDGLSGTISRGQGGVLERVAQLKTRDSLGLFYQEVTSLLGMRILEDEGKVMALADHAGSLRSNPMLSFFSCEHGRLRARVSPSRRYHRLNKLLQSTSPEVFARMAQETLEHFSAELVGYYAGGQVVCFAGGLFSNIKNNRRVLEGINPSDWHIFPHMGDGGLAAGAALAVAGRTGAQPAALDSVNLGPAFSDERIREALSRTPGVSWEQTSVVPVAADAIARKDIVFWFQGAMEYGPRALGSRSILAHPDDPALRDRLNSRIKRREWYQPFCPSILESEARELFEPFGKPDPFMTNAYRIRRADVLRGVRDNEGTCRPQMVMGEGVYAQLLEAVKERTGVGAVLNTSFNIHGEPLVATPEDALDVFLRTDEGILILGNYVVKRWM
ncbi:MAG: carbamoyltransferase C-terminal domain-containing protein [Nanobdellota archaeon]